MHNNFTRFQIFIYSFCVLSLFQSCAYEVVSDTTNIIQLEQEINVEILPVLSDKNRYNLHVSTLDTEVCEGSEILIELSSIQGNNSIFINGIESPSNCTELLEHISTTKLIELDKPVNDLNIIIANFYNYIRINKNDDGIEILPGDLKGIRMKQEVIKTIKDNHFWAGLNSSISQEQSTFFDLYYDLAENLIYQPISKGNYGFFQVQDERITCIHPETFKESNVGFALELNPEVILDETKFGEIVSNFRINHPELEFFIYDGKGQQY